MKKNERSFTDIYFSLTYYVFGSRSMNQSMIDQYKSIFHPTLKVGRLGDTILQVMAATHSLTINCVLI